MNKNVGILVLAVVIVGAGYGYHVFQAKQFEKQKEEQQRKINSDLCGAVVNRDIGAVKSLLDSGADPNATCDGKPVVEETMRGFLKSDNEGNPDVKHANEQIAKLQLLLDRGAIFSCDLKGFKSFGLDFLDEMEQRLPPNQRCSK